MNESEAIKATIRETVETSINGEIVYRLMNIKTNWHDINIEISDRGQLEIYVNNERWEKPT